MGKDIRVSEWFRPREPHLTWAKPTAFAKCSAALNESDPMDMLVKLYDLPKSCAVFERLREQGIHIRRALAAEKHKIAAWVRENFAEGWASETEIPLAAR